MGIKKYLPGEAGCFNLCIPVTAWVRHHILLFDNTYVVLATSHTLQLTTSVWSRLKASLSKCESLKHSWKQIRWWQIANSTLQCLKHSAAPWVPRLVSVQSTPAVHKQNIPALPFSGTLQLAGIPFSGKYFIRRLF